jgi:hypothetical protein
MFSDEDLDVRKSDLYNWFTTKGIKLKSNNTSMSRSYARWVFDLRSGANYHSQMYAQTIDLTSRCRGCRNY